MNTLFSPHFVWGKNIIKASPVYFVLLLIINLGYSGEPVIPLCLGFAGYFVTPFVLFNAYKHLLYKRTTFTLQKSGMRNKVDFISFKEESIKYKDIKEVLLYQDPLQRFFRLGTVKATTHATSNLAGITIYDIKNYQEVYDFLMEKTKEYN